MFQKALRRYCPYLPNTEVGPCFRTVYGKTTFNIRRPRYTTHLQHTFGPAAKREEHDGVVPGASTPVPATIPDEKKK